MKKFSIILVSCLLLSGTGAAARVCSGTDSEKAKPTAAETVAKTGNYESPAEPNENEDKGVAANEGDARENTPEYRKTGWSITPFPAVSYGSDLGFQIGVFLDTYYFGDGSAYPDYLHKITAEAAYFTKGSGIYHIFYDSKHLLRGLRLTLSASYLPSTMMSFHGFNGYASPYSMELREQYGAFYNMRRNMFRTMGDLQGRLWGKLWWSAGVAFYNYRIGSVELEKYSGQPSLYELYLREGLIGQGEKSGGSHLELRLGAVYDTRDHEPDPARGIYANALLYGSPDILNRRGEHYLKLAASFSHYLPLWRERLTLAYRISYQGTVAGNAPFYVQQNYTMLFLRRINADILGGGFSLRGVEYNRVVGDGMAWSNIEIRYRFFDFKLFGQQWYMVLNPFLDAGMVVQPYRLAEMQRAEGTINSTVYGYANCHARAHTAADNYNSDHADNNTPHRAGNYADSPTRSAADAFPPTAGNYIYSGQRERPHISAGVGIKLVMNRNFVISAEYGVPFDRRDGPGGFYLDLNYIF